MSLITVSDEQVKITANKILEEIKKEYGKEVVELIEKGDILTCLVKLFYYYGTKKDNKKLIEQIKNNVRGSSERKKEKMEYSYSGIQAFITGSILGNKILALNDKVISQMYDAFKLAVK